MVLVHEEDLAKGGAPLDVLRLEFEKHEQQKRGFVVGERYTHEKRGACVVQSHDAATGVVVMEFDGSDGKAEPGEVHQYKPSSQHKLTPQVVHGPNCAAMVFERGDIVKWQRIAEFQAVSLRIIAEGVIAQCPAYLGRPQVELRLYLPNALHRQTLVLPPGTRVHVSKYNPGAEELAREIKVHLLSDRTRSGDYTTAALVRATAATAATAIKSARRPSMKGLSAAASSSKDGLSSPKSSPALPPTPMASTGSLQDSGRTPEALRKKGAKVTIDVPGDSTIERRPSIGAITSAVTVQTALKQRAEENASIEPSTSKKRERRGSANDTLVEHAFVNDPAGLEGVAEESGVTLTAGMLTHMLLVLNERTFKGDDGDELFDEVKAARDNGVEVVMAHECDLRRGGCEFVRFFSTTPQMLISGGLYDKLAVAFHAEPYRQVSLALVAKALGAAPPEKRALFDHQKQMQKTLAQANKRRNEATQRAGRVKAEAFNLSSEITEIVNRAPSPFKRSGTKTISLAPSELSV